MAHVQHQSFLTPMAQNLCLSPTLKINELVQSQRDAGNSVVHLGFGEATFPMQQNVLQIHQEASNDTSYLPVAGLPQLQESIARFQTRRLGSPVEAEQIVIAPGSKPLLFALFDILSGDVLLPRPSWVSYEPQVQHAGKKLFWVETDQWDRHSISCDALEKAFNRAIVDGGNPRIMLVNSPSNPTGQVFDKATIDIITAFCRERGITLISDEIYSDILFAPDTVPSPATSGQLNNSQIILTGGLSKTYSAGGWRVGYAIFPTTPFGSNIRKAILAYASECWSAASAPAQAAAAAAFDTTPEMDTYRQQVMLTHKACTMRMYRALQECGLAVPEPKGAFYVYPSFYPYTKELEALGITTSAQLSRWLIEGCGVAALPGTVFGEDDDGCKGGRYRLRIATSCLYFKDREDRYNRGYEILSQGAVDPEHLKLDLLDQAIEAIQVAVKKLKTL